MPTPHSIKIPGVSRQVVFHQLLVAARKTWLMDALRTALASIDPRKLKAQLITYVPRGAQQILAAAGVREAVISLANNTPKTQHIKNDGFREDRRGRCSRLGGLGFWLRLP